MRRLLCGRVREITIPGGAGLKLAAPDTLPDAVEKVIDDQAHADHDSAGVDVNDRRAALKDEAPTQAQVLFAQKY